MQSKHCVRELGYALNHDIPILRVDLDGSALPPGLELGLQDEQAIDARAFRADRYFEKLLLSLRAKPPTVRTATARRLRAALRRPKNVRVLLLVAALAVGAAWLVQRTVTMSTEGEAAVALQANPAIAVLPFTNLSNDPNQEFFSDGLTTDILNGLAEIPGLDVVARTSSFRFKHASEDARSIGAQLRATHLLEGTVRTSADRVRISAQLIDAAKGTQIWSRRYARDLDDVFAVQDEITKAILGVLNLHFAPAETGHRTSNPDAYNALLRGRHHEELMEIEQAVERYERAIALDPRYANAYSRLAVAHLSYVWVRATGIGTGPGGQRCTHGVCAATVFCRPRPSGRDRRSTPPSHTLPQ